MKTQWTGRVVTDTRGDAGAIILDDGSTARAVLEDWPHDYYDGLTADDMAWVVDTATGTEIAYEDRGTPLGGYGLRVRYDGEWSAERSAEAIHERPAQAGEPVTMSRTAVSLGTVGPAPGDDRGESGDEALAGAWWRCGDEGGGWITDEADVEIAAEYLYAVAHEN